MNLIGQHQTTHSAHLKMEPTVLTYLASLATTNSIRRFGLLPLLLLNAHSQFMKAPALVLWHRKNLQKVEVFINERIVQRIMYAVSHLAIGASLESLFTETL